MASAYGGSNSSIVLWSYPELKPKKELLGHSGPISVVIQVENNYLVSCSFDTTIIVWDLDKYRGVFSLDCHLSPILSASYHQKSQILICGALDFSICICALDFSGPTLTEFKLMKRIIGEGPIMDIAPVGLDRFLTLENTKICVYDTRGFKYSDFELKCLPSTFQKLNNDIGVIIDADGLPSTFKIA